MGLDMSLQEPIDFGGNGGFGVLDIPAKAALYDDRTQGRGRPLRPRRIFKYLSTVIRDRLIDCINGVLDPGELLDGKNGIAAPPRVGQINRTFEPKFDQTGSRWLENLSAFGRSGSGRNISIFVLSFYDGCLGHR